MVRWQVLQLRVVDRIHPGVEVDRKRPVVEPPRIPVAGLQDLDGAASDVDLVFVMQVRQTDLCPSQAKEESRGQNAEQEQHGPAPGHHRRHRVSPERAGRIASRVHRSRSGRFDSERVGSVDHATENTPIRVFAPRFAVSPRSGRRSGPSRRCTPRAARSWTGPETPQALSRQLLIATVRLPAGSGSRTREDPRRRELPEREFHSSSDGTPPLSSPISEFPVHIPFTAQFVTRRWLKGLEREMWTTVKRPRISICNRSGAYHLDTFLQLATTSTLLPGTVQQPGPRAGSKGHPSQCSLHVHFSCARQSVTPSSPAQSSPERTQRMRR